VYACVARVEIVYVYKCENQPTQSVIFERLSKLDWQNLARLHRRGEEDLFQKISRDDGAINCCFKDKVNKGIFLLHDEEAKEATILYNGSHIPDSYDIVEKKY
jgi:hypothetical protein